MFIHNYYKKFQGLLWIEELEQIADLRKNDLFGIRFEQEGEYFSCFIPGLIESFKLETGDCLILKKSSGRQHQKRSIGIEYKVYIHFVRILEERIFVQFPESLAEQQVSSMRFDVFFQHSRTTLTRQHYAVENIAKHFDLTNVFQTRNTIRRDFRDRQPSIIRMKKFNPMLNERQTLAVQRIIDNAEKGPYIQSEFHNLIIFRPNTDSLVTKDVNFIGETLKI